jgi:hypothetical protein
MGKKPFRVTEAERILKVVMLINMIKTAMKKIAVGMVQAIHSNGPTAITCPFP